MYIKFIISVTLLFILSACASKEKDINISKQCNKLGKTGKCKAYFIKYHFNKKTNQCEEYIYGGCGEVVFDTIKECKNTCK